MLAVRFHPMPPDQPNSGPGSGTPSGIPTGAGCGVPGVPGGRLNLLLSCGGWQPESWADRLPRLLEPMGVVSHRAGTGRQATAVMQSTPIHIAIVDLGLPLDASDTPEQSEEGGTRVLELLARLEQPPPTVVVKRTRSMRDDRRELAAALRMGAFAVIDQPRETSDLDLLLDVMRRVLTRHYKGRWPA